MGALVLCASAAAAEQADPLVLITDRAALAWLEAHGFTLGERLAGPKTGAGQVLANKTAYGMIAERITGALKQIPEEDENAGVGIVFAHRVFDWRWLASAAARFELVGVANRLDRGVFEPHYGRKDSCGEVRLIYRLAYSVPTPGGQASSRLPMTLNLGFTVKKEDGACLKAAQRWVAPAGSAGVELARWLRSDGGPLAATRVSHERLNGVAVNIQQVRWPASVHRTFGGHSEYLLTRYSAALEPDGATLSLTPSPLENTPDLERFRGNEALKKEFLGFLTQKENLAALDQGTLVIPSKFLARRSISVAPRGFERKINRPWRRVIGPKRLRKLELAGFKTIGSPEALIRRLDALSCAGCHQARSHAGFHLLGEDPADQKWDAMKIPFSPHLMAEKIRRTERLRAVLKGQTAPELQPSAELDFGRYGSHCGLPLTDENAAKGKERDPALAKWTCGKGLKCTPVGHEKVGACLPRRGPRVGDPCEIGRVQTWRDPRRDRAVGLEVTECRGSRCVTTDGGLPLGMCRAYCGASTRVACGVMPGGGGFSGCLAAKKPFAECISAAAVKVGLKPCGTDKPCRDDYLCARPPDGGTGTCLPPYFLFQLRADGHPDAPE